MARPSIPSWRAIASAVTAWSPGRRAERLGRAEALHDCVRAGEDLRAEREDGRDHGREPGRDRGDREGDRTREDDRERVAAREVEQHRQRYGEAGDQQNLIRQLRSWRVNGVSVSSSMAGGA
jgi:hypothetical protein